MQSQWKEEEGERELDVQGVREKVAGSQPLVVMMWELPCRLGDLQGQIKMVWDRNSPTQERTELSVSSP